MEGGEGQRGTTLLNLALSVAPSQAPRPERNGFRGPGLTKMAGCHQYSFLEAAMSTFHPAPPGKLTNIAVVNVAVVVAATSTVAL